MPQQRHPVTPGLQPPHSHDHHDIQEQQLPQEPTWHYRRNRQHSTPQQELADPANWMLAEASTADVADEGGVGGDLQDSDLDIAEEQEELPPEPITQPTTIINVIF